MTTQLGDLLAAHAAAVAASWARLAGNDPSLPAEGAEREAFAASLLAAVDLAMADHDVGALRRLYRLDQPATAARAGTALRHLQLLRCAASSVTEADAEGMGGEIDEVIRRLSVDCIERAEAKVGGTARGAPSLSVTMHELRRPLTILSSYGQLLSSGMLGDLPESAIVAVEGITASTEMMVRMVTSIAELARLEDPDDRLNLETLTATELVRGAVDQVRTEAKLRDISIRSHVASGIRIDGDRRRLTLALVNLLSNAVKHGPSRSTVDLTVSREGDVARFVVRDQGEGFPDRDAPHLFDKYFRSVSERRRKVPGSGLGLYIVRTVAERHGGRVGARSRPGEGAEFEIMLPMHQGSAEA